MCICIAFASIGRGKYSIAGEVLKTRYAVRACAHLRLAHTI